MYRNKEAKYIKGKKGIYLLPLKYPEIPLNIMDIYVTTTAGDRLDLLAHQFYHDVDLWWIISSANPSVIRRDSLVLEPGLEIRIPASIQFILEEFERINK